MQRRSAGAATALMTIIGLTPTWSAAAAGDDAIKYRHAVMEEMAAHMSALTLIMSGKVDGSAYMQGHADALARATTELDVLFPEVSRDGDTEALAKIWQEPAEFSQAIDKAQKRAAQLREAIGDDDQRIALTALADTGKACKACHETYRAEDDDSDNHSH